PGGSDPDPGDPDGPDDDDNASDPSIKGNPILVLTNAITHLSNATKHRPKDSGAACTKVFQCELNFHDRPQAFCLDLQKVSFALSFLKGIALTWFEPNLLSSIPGSEPTWANDYLEFIIELTTNFSPHDPSSSLSKQSSSGGSPSKQSNTSSGTSSLSSAGKGKNPQHPSSSTPKSSDTSTPDLSGVLGKDGKLTAMECLHHIKNALYLFCGLPGHLAKDCPRSMSCTAKACTAQAASVAAPTAETPAEVKK
ncbi:hypothetical protein ID866_12923, partial [Astraeus odoratus]